MNRIIPLLRPCAKSGINGKSGVVPSHYGWDFPTQDDWYATQILVRYECLEPACFLASGIAESYTSHTGYFRAVTTNLKFIARMQGWSSVGMSFSEYRKERLKRWKLRKT